SAKPARSSPRIWEAKCRSSGARRSRMWWPAPGAPHSRGTWSCSLPRARATTCSRTTRNGARYSDSSSSRCERMTDRRWETRLLALLPFTHGLAPTLNGARRWVDLGFVTVQPSELAKFAVVVWTAMLAAKKGEQIRTFRNGVLPFLVILAPLVGLIFLEPNLSMA